jgi:hypothetical protein
MFDTNDLITRAEEERRSRAVVYAIGDYSACGHGYFAKLGDPRCHFDNRTERQTVSECSHCSWINPPADHVKHHGAEVVHRRHTFLRRECRLCGLDSDHPDHRRFQTEPHEHLTRAFMSEALGRPWPSTGIVVPVRGESPACEVCGSGECFNLDCCATEWSDDG